MLKKRDLSLYEGIEKNQAKTQPNKKVKSELEVQPQKSVPKPKVEEKSKIEIKKEIPKPKVEKPVEKEVVKPKLENSVEKMKIQKETPVNTQPKPNNVYTIIIRNIPRKDTENEFKKIFNFDEIRLPKFKDSDELKGIAFLDFYSYDTYLKSLEYNGFELNGFKLVVEKSKQTQNAPPQQVPQQPLKVERIQPKSIEAPKTFTSKPQFSNVKSSNVYTICVRNIPRKNTEADLKELFQSDEIRLPTYKDSTELKGIAFIDFHDEKKYFKSLEYNGYELNGFKLVVEKSKQSQSQSNQTIQPNQQPQYTQPPTKEYQKPQIFTQKTEYQKPQVIQSSFTICVRNIPRKDPEADLKKLFDSEDIRLPTFKDSTELKGLAFIDFQDESKYLKALELNGHELNGFKLVVEKSKKQSNEVMKQNQAVQQPQFTQAPKKEYQKPVAIPQNSYTICVRNIPRNDPEADLKKLFESDDIRLPTFKDSTELKGLAFIDYQDESKYLKALELNGHELNGFKLVVEKSKKQSNDTIKKVQQVEVEDKPQYEPPVEQRGEKMAIFNLTQHITEDDLRNHFKDSGEIVEIVRPKFDSGKLKNFAFIFFENSLGAFNALQLNGSTLKRSVIKVQKYEKINRGENKEDKSELIDNIKYNKQKIIHVGNLPFYVNDQMVRDLFSECGTIKEIRIPVHKDSGRVKGFAFIEFDTEEGAQNALKWNQSEVDKRKISVQFTSFN